MTLKLNGTNSEAAPAYAGDDADTGLQCGTNELKLVTGGTARATVDSSGNVGIGESAPDQRLHVKTSSDDVAKLESTSGGNGPNLTFAHTGASPADDDTISKLTFIATNDNSQETTFADIKVISTDVSDGSEDAAFTFNTRNNGTFAERMRILSSGGIAFNGDTAQANALDDYEEGDWTPAITFGDSSTGIAHSAQAGKYTKIGRVVLFQGYVQLSNKGSATGILKIGGLPYTSLNASTAYSTTSLRVNNSPSGSEIPAGYVNVNDTRIVVNRQLTNGTGTDNWTEAHTNNTTDFILNGHYIV